MPVKNAERFLTETWQSIISQNYSDWELIAVNDNSQDKSFELLQNLAMADTRLKVLQNRGEGVLPALQTAFTCATGEFITRMDADDLMPPQRLNKMVILLENSPPKTVVTGQVKYFSDGEVSKGYQNYQHWLNRTNLRGEQWKMIYRECVVASPNWMMRSNELSELGGFQGLEYPEDYDLVFKWYQHGFNIKSLKETTLLWREHPDRTSRNSKLYQQKSFFNLKIKRFLELEYRDQDIVLLGTGQKGKIAARTLEKQKVKFHWLALFPEDHPNGIRKHEIEGLNTLASYANPLVLVAVYPPEKQRMELINYLHSTGLEEGLNYWFL